MPILVPPWGHRPRTAINWNFRKMAVLGGLVGGHIDCTLVFWGPKLS